MYHNTIETLVHKKNLTTADSMCHTDWHIFNENLSERYNINQPRFFICIDNNKYRILFELRHIVKIYDLDVVTRS